MFGKQMNCNSVEDRTLILRPYGKEKLPRVTEWVNNPDTTRYLGSDFGYTPEQEEKWFDKIVEAKDQCQWGIFWDGRHVGNAGLMKIRSVDRNAIYGILIGERDCWGKGIGTIVAKAIAAYSFSALNLEHIYADVFLPNEGSKIALERAGFKECSRRPGAKFIDGAYCVNWQCYLGRSEWLQSQKEN